MHDPRHLRHIDAGRAVIEQKFKERLIPAVSAEQIFRRHIRLPQQCAQRLPDQRVKRGNPLKRVAQLHHPPDCGDPVRLLRVVTPFLPEKEIDPGKRLQIEVHRKMKHALILIVQDLPERRHEDTLPRRQRNRLGVILKRTRPVRIQNADQAVVRHATLPPSRIRPVINRPQNQVQLSAVRLQIEFLKRRHRHDAILLVFYG